MGEAIGAQSGEEFHEKKLIKSLSIMSVILILLTVTVLAARSRSCPRCGDIQGTYTDIGDYNCHRTVCVTCKTAYLQPHTSNGQGVCTKCKMFFGGR